MGFPQDMGIWRCNKCNRKVKEPFYIGDDMMCEVCYTDYRYVRKTMYRVVEHDIKIVIEKLEDIMENDESGYEMSTAVIRLNDALSAIEKEFVNGI